MHRWLLSLWLSATIGGCSNAQTERPSAEAADSAQAAVMKIRFERSGGFAGITRSFVVDVDALSDDERSVVQDLIGNAGFFALPAVVPEADRQGADLYHYRITVESSDGVHTVEATQLSAPASLEPLISWLDRAVRQP